MKFFIYGTQIILLVVIIFQDMKYRAVYWLLFPLLFACNTIITYLTADKQVLQLNFVVNLGIIISHMLILTLYFSVKTKGLVNIINNYIGLGDMLMLIACTVIFSPLAYIIFILISLIFSLLFALLSTKTGTEKKTIPLAGIMSTVFLPVTCLLLFAPDWPFLTNIFQLNQLFLW